MNKMIVKQKLTEYLILRHQEGWNFTAAEFIARYGFAGIVTPEEVGRLVPKKGTNRFQAKNSKGEYEMWFRAAKTFNPSLVME